MKTARSRKATHIPKKSKVSIWTRTQASTEVKFELPVDREHAKKEAKEEDDDFIDPKAAERLRINKELRKSGEKAGPVNEDDENEKKKWKWLETLREYAAKADGFASAHTVPKHQVCIAVATAMIPLSMIAITWDLMAVVVFQIPHLSTINLPAFILFINFVAMPLAMYGYMMEYLMHESSRIAILGLICVIVHPILFFIRSFMEYQFDGYRNERKLYFESGGPGEVFEYPIGTFDPEIGVE